MLRRHAHAHAHTRSARAGKAEPSRPIPRLSPLDLGLPAGGHGQQAALRGAARLAVLPGGGGRRRGSAQPVGAAQLQEAAQVPPGALQVLPPPARLHLPQRQRSQQRGHQQVLQVGRGDLLQLLVLAAKGTDRLTARPALRPRPRPAASPEQLQLLHHGGRLLQRAQPLPHFGLHGGGSGGRLGAGLHLLQ